MISIYQYAALGIDFEGSIALGKHTNKCGAIGFRPNVRVHNTSLPLLRHFASVVGCGSIPPDPSLNEKGAPIYVWRLLVNEIREQLPLIAPYLILKNDQAILLIEALSILKTKSFMYSLNNLQRAEMYSSEEHDRLLSIYLEMKKLNAKPSSRIKQNSTVEFYNQLRKRGI